MSDREVYLYFLLFAAVQFASMRKRWSLALFRGAGWFLGVPVPPGFHAGPGRRLLRTFRLWLLAPYALEVLLVAGVLSSGRPVHLLYVSLAMVVVVGVNSVLATRVIRLHEPVAA